MGDPAQSQPDVFLSYAREDEARARQLATALGQRGFSVFWDREIPPGQTWHSYIGEALANARCVVVAWSRHSVASQWVLEEASEGKDRNVLVPVLFEAVPPPFGFRAIQAASLIDWRPGQRSAAFEGLLGAIRRIVGGQAGSGTGPGVTDEPHSEAAEPSRRQSRAWSRRTVLATVVGLFAIAGGGGATLIWWRTQPGQLDPTALSSTPAASEPVAETMLTTAPEQTITLYFHFSGDPVLASDTAAKLRQTGYSVPPIKGDFDWCGREVRYFNEKDAQLAVRVAQQVTSILYESGFGGVLTSPKDLVDYSQVDVDDGTLELWLSLPPRGDPPNCTYATTDSGVRAQIFTHDVGLTEQDAIRLKALLENNGIPTAVYPHIDRRAPDAAFIGAFVTAEEGQMALSAAPYAIQYIFPPDYSEIEGGDLSGFTIGLGYMSSHNQEFREFEPVEISKSELRALLEPGISNLEFQRRLDQIYDKKPTAASPVDVQTRSR